MTMIDLPTSVGLRCSSYPASFLKLLLVAYTFHPAWHGIRLEIHQRACHDGRMYIWVGLSPLHAASSLQSLYPTRQMGSKHCGRLLDPTRAMTHISSILTDQTLCQFIELVEIVTLDTSVSLKDTFNSRYTDRIGDRLWFESKPVDHFRYRSKVLFFFCFWIRVVVSEVALAAMISSKAKVDGNRFPLLA